MKIKWAATLMALGWAAGLNAGHPLATDDTGTQGKCGKQMELTAEVVFDRADEVAGRVVETGATLTLGLAESVDLVLSLPYQSVLVTAGDEKLELGGWSDLGAELKWRCVEDGKFSLAVKPGVSLPSGDSAKGLSADQAAFQAVALASLDTEPVSLHLNIGYAHNPNGDGDETDLWSASLAGIWQVLDQLALVADLGMERSAAWEAVEHPAFALAGLVYSPKENLDLDLGVKFGLNGVADDVTALAGTAVRF